MIFTSDNSVGAPDEIIQAISTANANGYPSYGGDPFSQDAAAQIRDFFETKDAAVYFVSTGTAANALALATLADPWQAIYCYKNAHIFDDECGAPEFFSGAKLVPCEGKNGKLIPKNLTRQIEETGSLGVHNIQKGPISLTNSTEMGSVYTASETQEICEVARRFNLPVHLDGARLANAIVSTGASAADLTWKAGVDIAVFGGTKAGLLFGEAVVIFDPNYAWEFELRRKRAGHLLSKGRYLGASFQGLLKNNNWQKWAENANSQMQEIYRALNQKENIHFEFTVDANIAFISFPRKIHQALQKAGAKYLLTPNHQSLDGDPEELITARFVASWATTDEEIRQFITYFNAL